MVKSNGLNLLGKLAISLTLNLVLLSVHQHAIAAQPPQTQTPSPQQTEEPKEPTDEQTDEPTNEPTDEPTDEDGGIEKISPK